MNIWTTELTDATTVINGIAALTGGTASTTVSVATLVGDAIVKTGSITGFTAGCTLVIDLGGANEEYILVGALSAGSPNLISLYHAMSIAHSVGESVAIVDAILTGQDRTYLVNGHLDQSYELDSVQEAFAYLLDTNVTGKVQGLATVLKNFRSNPWATSGVIMQYMSSGNNSNGGGIFVTGNKTVLASEFGNGYSVAVHNFASTASQRYLMVGFRGTLGSAAAQIAQFYMLNKHTLSHNWEIADREQLPHGASIMESRSGKTFVQSHTNNARRDFTKQFKALRQTDVDTLREVYRLSDGARRPFIADFAATEVASNLLLVRFANDNAIQINQTHFDQYDVTMQLQSIKQEDDR